MNKLLAVNTYSPHHKRFYCSKMNTQSHHYSHSHPRNQHRGFPNFRMNSIYPSPFTISTSLSSSMRLHVDGNLAINSIVENSRQISRENFLPYLSSHLENFENFNSVAKLRIKSPASNFLYQIYFFQLL